MKSVHAQEFQQLVAEGEVIEQDARGAKVIALPGGRYLKIFYLKSWFLSAQLRSRAQQFARNARKLRQRNIESVTTERLFKLAAPTRHCVLYQGVPGQTVRQMLEQSPRDRNLSRQVGAHIAKLHDRGVMFRSLHMGNIIVQPVGQLTLIDIADLRANWFALNRWQRKRNFQHVFRYACDKDMLNLDAFVEGYCEESHGRIFSVSQLRPLIEEIQTVVKK